jgi:hypothetical protein
VSAGKRDAPGKLHELITRDYSPFHLDRIIDEVFAAGLAGELVSLWLANVEGQDLALDVYVPPARHEEVKRLLEQRGYLPVQLSWERVGQPPLPDEMIAQRAEEFYLSMLSAPVPQARDTARETQWDPAGYVDEIAMDGNQLRIRGWAVDESGSLPAKILMKIGGRTKELEDLQRQLRPDVQRHLGLPHALVGYSVLVNIPGSSSIADLPGDLKVYAPGGATFKLGADVATALGQSRRRGV